MARYLVTIYLWGYSDRIFQGTGDAYVYFHGQVHELLGQRSYFVDKISTEVFTQLRNKARKSYKEKSSEDSEVNITTIHQVVVLPQENDTPPIKLEEN